MASDFDSSPEHVASTPKQIGKYRIIRQIAQGGMAEIFLASASGIEGFEKLCVLKRILPILAGNKEFVEMFLDEARIAASLLHSNIAQVFDIGSDRGSYYFVMELLRGEDVRHVLRAAADRRQLVPYEHVATIIIGVCAGLHYAHEMRGRDGRPLQIVHRDISPQNVFVTHDGSVKLCDFGIAKSAARLTETRVGTLKGKVRYMSPEQCQSKPLDRRSDVFSLSIVLWELITLRRLYAGESDFEICKSIIETDAQPPSAFRRDVPDALDAIVMKGLARDREQRFANAQEMQLALVEWTRSERVPSSAIHLAAYMESLFGPPATNDTFLDKVSEVDPLAQRIRAHNEKELSSGARPTPRALPVVSLSAADEIVTRADMPEHMTPALDLGTGALRARGLWPVLVVVVLMLAVGGVFFVRARQGSVAPPIVRAPVVQPIELPVAPTPTIEQKPIEPAPIVVAAPPVDPRHRRKPDVHPKPEQKPQAVDENAIKNPFGK